MPLSNQGNQTGPRISMPRLALPGHVCEELAHWNRYRRIEPGPQAALHLVGGVAWGSGRAAGGRPVVGRKGGGCLRPGGTLCRDRPGTKLAACIWVVSGGVWVVGSWLVVE